MSEQKFLESLKELVLIFEHDRTYKLAWGILCVPVILGVLWRLPEILAFFK